MYKNTQQKERTSKKKKILMEALCIIEKNLEVTPMFFQ